MSILTGIFYSQEKEEFRDPNDPANSPFYNAKRRYQSLALRKWKEEYGGDVLIDAMTKKIVAQIIEMIIVEPNALEDLVKLVRLQERIKKDVGFIDRITAAFLEEKKKTS